MKRYYYSTFILFLIAIVCNGQVSTILFDEFNNSIKNKKIIISQGSLNLERFTDYNGVLEVQVDLFKPDLPLYFIPDGFKAEEIDINDIAPSMRFKRNLFELAPVILKEKRSKKLIFKNYKDSSNILKGALGKNKIVHGPLIKDSEFIIHIPEFVNNNDYGAIKSIAFEVRNRSRQDTAIVSFRLNLYDANQVLIFSKDEMFRLSEIRKELIFKIPTDVLLEKQVAHIGIAHANINEIKDFWNSPINDILFVQSEFITPKTNILRYTQQNAQWQIVALDNTELDIGIKHRLNGNPQIIDLKNFNLHITIISN